MAARNTDQQLITLLKQHQQVLLSDGGLNGTTQQAREQLADAVSRGLDLSDLEALSNWLASQQKPVPSPAAGLPPEARFLNVIGKAPTVKGWSSDESQWLSWEEAAKQRKRDSSLTGTGLITGSRCGNFCWLDFDGESTDQDGTVTESATADFEFLFHRPATDLPAAPANTSGKPGRRRLLFRVPEDWAPLLAGLSFNNGGPTGSFDFIYEKGSGASMQHAVIDGRHQDGNGYYYRWEPGCSPADLAIPDLPSWLIQGLILYRGRAAWAQDLKDEERESRPPSVGGETGPMDLLHPGQQRKLLSQMQKHWPYRAPRDQFKPEELGAKGHYATMVSLVLSLARGIGDMETMELWLEGGHWDRLNDWAGNQAGVNPVNGGSLMSFARSLMRSDTEKKEVQPWASAWKIATDNGWKPPKWALPPREIDADSLAKDVVRKVDSLKKGLNFVDGLDTPLERALATQNLQKSLDCGEKEFKKLLEVAINELSGSGKRGGDWLEVVAKAKPIATAVERLIAFNALTVVGSDGGVGKTVLIYRLAEAAASGGLFGGALQAEKGNVLIIQKDESDSNLAQKNSRMQLNVQPGTVRVEFDFNANMFPELRKWIKEHQARYVLMDSLISLFGSSGDINESDIGLVMYQLNRIAAEEGCAIVLTHHLRKGDKSKGGKRTEVSMSDLYGSAFIASGTSDVLTVMRDPTIENTSEPKFLMKVVKDRSGVSKGGDTFAMTGSAEDLSYLITDLNHDSEAVSKLRDNARKLMQELKTRTAENPMTINQMCGAVGVGDKTARRIIGELMGNRSLRVHRVQKDATGGRPSYGYWAE